MAAALAVAVVDHPSLRFSAPPQPSGSPRRPAATYRRRRVAAAVLVTTAVLLAVVGLRSVVASGTSPSAAAHHGGGAAGVDYVVQPGDTMWDLAVRLRPGHDPRPTVDRLVAAHGGTTLTVGERIRLSHDGRLRR